MITFVAEKIIVKYEAEYSPLAGFAYPKPVEHKEYFEFYKTDKVAHEYKVGDYVFIPDKDNSFKIKRIELCVNGGVRYLLDYVSEYVKDHESYVNTETEIERMTKLRDEIRKAEDEFSKVPQVIPTKLKKKWWRFW